MSDRGGTESGAQHMITVTMRRPTVRALSEDDFALYLFQAVECDQGGGTPLVWASIREFAPTMTLSWSAGTYAYAAAADGGATGSVADAVSSGSLCPAGAGQIVAVGANAVTSTSPCPGDPAYITLLNRTSTPYACGLAQNSPTHDRMPAPFCAFPLYGNNLVFLAPLPRIALSFGTRRLRTGEPVGEIVGPTVLVDLTRPGPSHLGFDINDSWSSEGACTTDVGVGSLANALIIPSG